MLRKILLNIIPRLDRGIQIFLSAATNNSLMDPAIKSRDDGIFYFFSYRTKRLLLCFCLFMTGCAHAPSSLLPSTSPIAEKPTETPPIDIDAIPDATPKDEPLSPKGNDSPYEFAGKKYEVLPKAQSYSATGIASWYGKQFHGKKTASGERFDMFSMTGAHRSLPLPSYVKVTNLSNNKSVVIRINDRGPFTKGRLIDVSYAAAAKLGLIATGHARVKIEKVIPQKDTTEFETYPTSIENQTVSESPISQPASQ